MIGIVIMQLYFMAFYLEEIFCAHLCTYRYVKIIKILVSKQVKGQEALSLVSQVEAGGPKSDKR